MARAGEGVLAARAAGAEVPLNTPLSASAATVTTAAAATTLAVRRRRTVTCRGSHSLRVVASTRPHDGSAADRLPGVGTDGTVLAAAGCVRPRARV